MTIKKELQRSYYLMALLPVLFFISTAITINFFLNDHMVRKEERLRELPLTLTIIFTVIAILILIIMTLNLMITRNQIKRITLPLQQLEKSAQNIMEGSLKIPVIYEKDDEFTHLFQTFDEMRKQLAHSIDARTQLENNRTSFLNGMTHDILTPLTVIKGYVEALEDDIAQTKTQQERYLSIIKEKTSTIEQLVAKMTTINQFQSNHYPFHFEKYVIKDVLTHITDTLKRDYPQISFTIENTLPDTLHITLDVDEFHRIFINFVENSMKYANADPLSVTIRAALFKKQVCIIFADNGQGINEAHLPLIFDPFFRGDIARSNPQNGSGLGLAICKQIVNAHNGVLTATNKSGLQLTITLPLLEEFE